MTYPNTMPGAILGYRKNGAPIRLMAGGDRDGQFHARVAEIDSRLGEVRSELVAFADIEEQLTDEQVTRFDALEAEEADLAKERETVSRRAQTIDRMRSAQAVGGSRSRESGGVDVHMRSATANGPYGNLDQVRSGSLGASDMRSRALDAIEQAPDYVPDEHRERATRLVERSDKHGRVAKHMLLTGSPDYEAAFEEVLGGVQPWQLDAEAGDAMRTASEHLRSMSIGEAASVGYLVPFFLDPTIIMTSDGSSNPVRRLARQVSITTDKWHGITSAGVSTEWLAEAQEVGEHNPTLTRPEIPVHKAGSYLQATFEATQDTTIASQLGGLLAEAKDDEEASVFINGNGTSRPHGLVTAVAKVAASVIDSAEPGAFTDADVYRLLGEIPPRHEDNLSWLANKNTFIAARQFATEARSHTFWTDFGAATPSQMVGVPTYKASAMAREIAAAATPLLLGNMQRYQIVDRIGMTVQHEPLVKGSNGRPTGEVGWFAHWRIGGDVLDANAFRLLQIAGATPSP
ncbi:phage major capsid protein [Nocardiopsis alba]|uniref:phage major capsid protein n=1 Tax=Nocardiopsis alba TaxID=53437 RepID=UPI0036AFA4DE